MTYIQIDNPFFDRLATTELPGGLPLMVVVMFGCYALVAVALYRTAFGKYVYAVGSNRRAACVAGLPVRSTQIAAYVLCATLAAVAGVLNAARLGLVSPNDGVGLEFSSITAALVGGLSVTVGGVGRVERTLVGAVIVGMLVNYQTIRGVPPNLQQAMIGGVLLLAVVDRSAAAPGLAMSLPIVRLATRSADLWLLAASRSGRSARSLSSTRCGSTATSCRRWSPSRQRWRSSPSR